MFCSLSQDLLACKIYVHGAGPRIFIAWRTGKEKGLGQNNGRLILLSLQAHGKAGRWQ